MICFVKFPCFSSIGVVVVKIFNPLSCLLPSGVEVGFNPPESKNGPLSGGAFVVGLLFAAGFNLFCDLLSVAVGVNLPP